MKPGTDGAQATRPGGDPGRARIARRERYVLMVGALQLLLFLGEPDISGPHEGRVAATAREMAEGGDWIVPHLNEKVRIEKPPLAYWLPAVLWKVTGTYSQDQARLPAAFFGLIALLALMDLGRRWIGPSGGLACGIVWVSTFFVVDEYRKAMADPYLAGSVLVAVRSWVAGDDASRAGDGRRAALEALLFWLAAGAGTLAKGPVALVHLAMALVPYHIVAGRRPSLGRAHAAGVALFLAVSLPWPLAVLAREPAALSLWKAESLGQLSSAMSSRPWWYYLPQLFYLAAPWTLFLLDAVWWGCLGSSRDRRRILWPLLWAGAGVLFFSFSAMKKNAYLLPVFPALALATGTGLSAILENRAHWIPVLYVRVHAVLAVVALFVLVCLAARWTQLWGERSPVLLVVLSPAFAIVALQFRAALPRRGAETSGKGRAPPRRMLEALALALALIAHLKAAWLYPLHEAPSSPAPFARAVLQEVGDGGIHALGGVDEALLFHLGRKVSIWRDASEVPRGFRGYALLRASELQALAPAGEVLVVDGSGGTPEVGRLRLVRLGEGHP